MNDDQWLQHIFGLSLAEKNNPGMAQAAADILPTDALQFITRIFRNCEASLKAFTDQQAADGILYLISAGESGWMYYIYNPAIDQKVRYDCIRSFNLLFQNCFAHRCLNATTHHTSGISSINSVCYMWWEHFPTGGLPCTTPSQRDAIDRELIAVMSQTLTIEHAACQESSLHGLAHWSSSDEKLVQDVIDAWIATHQNMSPSLLAYAQDARHGNVQ